MYIINYTYNSLLQDKLLFEPYSTPKHIMYLVVCPGGETTLDTLINFFRNLSITYKVLLCHCQCCFDVNLRPRDLVVMFLLIKENGMKEL